MSDFLVIFGNTPELSFLELSSLFSSTKRISAHAAQVSQQDSSATSLMARLGGAVRIATDLGKVSQITAVSLAPFFSQESASFDFSISAVDGVDISHEVFEDLKKFFSLQGKHTRYVLPKDDGLVSSVAIERQHIVELIIVPSDDGFLVGKTDAVQPYEQWSTRDFGRPYADPKAGMLPPKIARMMVNIGAANGKRKKEKGEKILLDPFCGMGTILGEALLTGWNVIGSDQSDEVVGKAKKNLEWLVTLTGPGPVMKNWKIFVSDATHVSEHLAPNCIDAIVTEPFMGSAFQGGMIKSDQSDRLKKVVNIIKGLEKLYIGCLKDWFKVLKVNGKIVMAIPKYVIGEKTFLVKRVIDSCETLGYTILQGPIEYWRPQAIVRRKFFVLQKR